MFYKNFYANVNFYVKLSRKCSFTKIFTQMSIFIYYTISYKFRIIRQVTQEITGKKYRWTVGTLSAAHQGSEAYIITILEKGNLAAIHAGRVTLMPKDIQLAMRLADVTQNFKTTKPVTKSLQLDTEKEKKERGTEEDRVGESEAEEETRYNS